MEGSSCHDLECTAISTRWTCVMFFLWEEKSNVVSMGSNLVTGSPINCELVTTGCPLNIWTLDITSRKIDFVGGKSIVVELFFCYFL